MRRARGDHQVSAKGYRVLFGEGEAKWKEIFAAAETTGKFEYYLIEQEGSTHPPFETVERCLANFQKIQGRARQAISHRTTITIRLLVPYRER